ncbi:unnamed protein product [Clonostachys chloroleuca]|uniref:Uncharacterized protein n=1 Tax=Clonostachys chloroleuca TaxID=1926264 RepID=A0AA35PVT0_9HYPO|nr:unnamed protein product [Clonostachys chloroleuca]
MAELTGTQQVLVENSNRLSDNPLPASENTDGSGDHSIADGATTQPEESTGILAKLNEQVKEWATQTRTIFRNGRQNLIPLSIPLVQLRPNREATPLPVVQPNPMEAATTSDRRVTSRPLDLDLGVRLDSWATSLWVPKGDEYSFTGSGDLETTLRQDDGTLVSGSIDLSLRDHTTNGTGDPPSERHSLKRTRYHGDNSETDPEDIDCLEQSTTGAEGRGG